MRDKKKRIVDLKYLLMWNKLFLKEEVLNSLPQNFGLVEPILLINCPLTQNSCDLDP